MKMVRMWPPGGGEPIEVPPHAVETMERRGWRQDSEVTDDGEPHGQ